MTFEKAAQLGDIAVGTAVKRVVDGCPVAIVRLADGVVKAVHNICSHQHYELAPEGWIDDNTIECGLHGSTFDLDTGEPECLPAVVPIPVYACRIVDGAVWVDVAAQLNDADPPRH